MYMCTCYSHIDIHVYGVYKRVTACCICVHAQDIRNIEDAVQEGILTIYFNIKCMYDTRVYIYFIWCMHVYTYMHICAVWIHKLTQQRWNPREKYAIHKH